MKQLLLIFLSILTLNSFSQTAPAKGDYISCKTLGYDPVNYIFKNKKVFYGYNPTTKKTENSYKQDAKLTKELFDMADAAGLDKMKSLNESSLILERGDQQESTFSIIEYKKGNQIYRICWDPVANDEDSKKLNEISSKMNSFW